MQAHERADAVSEAIAVLAVLQDLLCHSDDRVQINAEGMFQLLDCVLERLRRAQ